MTNYTSKRKLEGILVSIDEVQWGVDMTEEKSAHLFEELNHQTKISVLGRKGKKIEIIFFGIIFPDSIKHPVKYSEYFFKWGECYGEGSTIKQELIDLTLDRKYIGEMHKNRKWVL